MNKFLEMASDLTSKYWKEIGIALVLLFAGAGAVTMKVFKALADVSKESARVSGAPDISVWILIIGWFASNWEFLVLFGIVVLVVVGIYVLGTDQGWW